EKPRGIGAPLVGRGEELRELLSARDRLLAGHGQVVVIIGEAGLGETPPVAALRSRLRKRITVLQGPRRAIAQATIYGVVVQYLLGYLGFGEDDPKEVGRLQLRAGLYQVFGSSPQGVHQALEHLLGLDTSREFEASVHGLSPEEIRSHVVRAI